MKRIEKVEEAILELGMRVSYLRTEQRKIPDMASCEKCGCLVVKACATKGLGKVKQRGIGGFHTRMEDYIYYPYYCKTHTPKEKK